MSSYYSFLVALFHMKHLLKIKKPALSRLKNLIPAGFEPATVRLEGECSIQLSYETIST